MRTILAQNELKKYYKYLLGFLLRLLLRNLNFDSVSCMLSLQFEGSSFSFKLVLVYTLSLLLNQKVLSLQQKHKEEVKFFFGEKSTLFGSLQGMKIKLSFNQLVELLPSVFNCKLIPPLSRKVLSSYPSWWTDLQP